MNPAAAWAVLLGLVAVTTGAFLVPWPVNLAAALVAIAGMRHGRPGFLSFAALTVSINAVLLAWADPGSGPAWTFGPVHLGVDGAIAGAVGGLRLVAILAVNLAVLGRITPARFLDGLRLPPRWTAFLAALLISAHDVGRDARRMMEARAPVNGRRGAARGAVALVPAVMVAAVQRAGVRRDALQVAGITMPRWFVPVVAVASVALAGRLLLVAVPNVALTFVVVFAGGLVFGPWVAASAAVIAMGLSNLLLSGLVPTAFVNVPAMALVGLLGGALRRIDLDGDHPAAGRFVAGAIGVLATFLFSVAADATEWALVPEFRGSMRLLQARVAAGLTFNLLPAVINGALFAAVALPVQRAFRAWPGR